MGGVGLTSCTCTAFHIGLLLTYTCSESAPSMISKGPAGLTTRVSGCYLSPSIPTLMLVEYSESSSLDSPTHEHLKLPYKDVSLLYENYLEKQLYVYAQEEQLL